MLAMNADDELIALEHENWIAYLTGVVRCTDAGRRDSHRRGGRDPDRPALRLVQPGPGRTRGGDTRRRARRGGPGARAGDPFVVRLREGIDDRFVRTLARAGLEPEGEATSTPGMVAFPIDHDSIARHAAPELEIRRVTDAPGIDAHRQVVTAGFGSDRAVALGTACPDLLDRPECVVYVGYADGAPVVSGLGWRSGRTIGVYSIATVESARRRGYGAAMVARVVADGVDAGCDVAALQASEMGRPIYERQGFRTVVRYVAYGPAAS